MDTQVLSYTYSIDESEGMQESTNVSTMHLGQRNELLVNELDIIKADLADWVENFNKWKIPLVDVIEQLSRVYQFNGTYDEKGIRYLQFVISSIEFSIMYDLVTHKYSLFAKCVLRGALCDWQDYSTFVCVGYSIIVLLQDNTKLGA